MFPESSLNKAASASDRRVAVDRRGTFRGSSSRLKINLAWRAAILVALLGCEKFLLNFFVDFQAAQSGSGVAEYVREGQHLGFRFLVSLIAAIALFAYVKPRVRLKMVIESARQAPIRASWLITFLALFVPLALLTYSFYGGHGLSWPVSLLAPVWLLTASLSVWALMLGLAPGWRWVEAAKALGALWGYATVAAAIGTIAMQWSQMLWAPTAHITFVLVGELLHPLIPTLTSNAQTQILDTGKFAVEVSSLCSGLEGAGLMLAFCGAWLTFFRKEYYFPRALILIPAGLIILFGLNVLRIAGLVLIGNAGYPEIAIYGFHSQAGWIAFNCTAGALAYLSHRSPWFNRTAVSQVGETGESAALRENATRAYLLPLLAILAAGMLSHAASGRFEILYPLRLVVGGAVIMYCWPKLRTLNWTFSWRGIAVGAGVFGMWLAVSHVLSTPFGMPAGLAKYSSDLQDSWILARALAAIITVPIAEELAYRGFVMRRLEQADFEALPFGRVRILALVVSSVAFGAAHGAWWAPGIVAGLAYGVLLMRTGRMGEAVAAHATSNALIAVWVLGFGQWQLW